jgi:hypothetical protein
MRATFRPLRKELWQGEFTKPYLRRSRWTFKAGWSDTLGLLDRELSQLGAKELVIEADFRESDIRLDGMPRANARQPEFPGVRIAFESKHGPLVYQTDTCTYWQHNVRSIALGLEALRAVDRYGITSRAEQYTGFKAIDSGPGITTEDAQGLLVAWAGREDERWPLVPDDQKKLVRQARANAHPDRHGGDHTHWNFVEGAIRFLRATGALT